MRASDLPPISQTYVGQLQAAIEGRDVVIQDLRMQLAATVSTIDRLRQLIDERDRLDATREPWT